MLRALVRAALGLFLTSALPLRAPARGSILSSCLKPWKGCPEGGSLSGSRLGENFAGFSEAMAMYEGGMSDKSGSMCAPHGENGLDRAAPKALATSPAATALRQLYKNHGADGLYADAFDSATIKGAAKAELLGENGLDRAASKVFATSVAETMARLQLYQNHAMLAAPNATKGGVDEEEAAQSSLFKFLAILVKVVFTFGWISVYVVFMFGWVVPRLSSLA